MEELGKQVLEPHIILLGQQPPPNNGGHRWAPEVQVAVLCTLEVVLVIVVEDVLGDDAGMDVDVTVGTTYTVAVERSTHPTS